MKNYMIIYLNVEITLNTGGSRRRVQWDCIINYALDFDTMVRSGIKCSLHISLGHRF